jgi:hypothetical protein
MRSNIAAGNVTTDAILSALPLGDTVTSLQLQGSDLAIVLQLSLSALGGASTGLFLQLAGLRITYNRDLPVGLRLISAMVVDPTSPTGYSGIKASQYYTVCTNSWLQGGGDGYLTIPQQAIGVVAFSTSVSDGTLRITVEIFICAAAREFVAEHNPLNIVLDGRIASTTDTQSNVTATPCQYSISFSALSVNVSDICAGSARVRTAFTWTIAPVASLPVRWISLTFSPLALLTFDTLLVLDACTPRGTVLPGILTMQSLLRSPMTSKARSRNPTILMAAG